MRRLPKLVFLPQSYEIYLAHIISVLWPVVIIYISFSVYYLNTYPFTIGNVPLDVPAICLFALFFAPYRFRNLCFFAIILSFFERSYNIQIFSSLTFYSILGLMTYLTLTLHKGLSYSFFTLMSAFLTLYAITLFCFWVISQFTDSPILFDHILSAWLVTFILYPICFSLFHISLIKRIYKPNYNAL